MRKVRKKMRLLVGNSKKNRVTDQQSHFLARFLLPEPLVDEGHEGGKLLGVVEAGELDDAAFGVDEDVARDACLAVGIEGEDVSTRVEAEGIGHLGLTGKGLDLV